MRLNRFSARIRCVFGRHEFKGCRCRVCGKEEHDWTWEGDAGDVWDAVGSFADEMLYYRKVCKRCGVKWEDME
jgi:hypothetical protein